MRRSASEVIRSLEMRIARLEKQAKYPEFPDYIMSNDEVSGIWPDSKFQRNLKVMNDLLEKSGFRFYEEKEYYVHYLHKGAVKAGQFKFQIRIEDLVEGDSLARVKSFIRLKDKVVSWVEMWLPTREKRHTYEYPIEYLEKDLKKILGNKKGKIFAINFAMDLLKHEGIYVS